MATRSDTREGPWLVGVWPAAKEATITVARPQSDARSDRAPNDAENRLRALRRAKGECRRHCRANGLRYLWVLTYAGGGCHDWAAMVEHVRELFRALEPRAVPCLVVPEWHPGGHGLHVNLALGSYIDWRYLQAAWPHGSVKPPTTRCQRCKRAGVKRCKHQRKHPRRTDPGLLASYCAGYITKGANAEHSELGKPGARTGTGRQRGGKRYFHTHGHQCARYVDAFATLAEAAEALCGLFGTAPARCWASWCERGQLPGAGPAAWLDFWPRTWEKRDAAG